MHWIDWSIVIGMLVLLLVIAVYCKRYVRSVADFLAADRLAGRYLLTVSVGFGGAISIISWWEMYYQAGFTSSWWGMINLPIGMFLALTGFIVYRFRQTRALTLAQFFEMRYSRRFRYYSGILCWVSGVLNYGIFPAITAKFIVVFFQFPTAIQLGPLSIATVQLIMLAYLALAVYIAVSGGQITIMITDFIQGSILLLAFVALMAYLLHVFSWESIVTGLSAAPPGQSKINPFDSGGEENFNLWFFLIGAFSLIYNARSWQGASGYNSAPRTPHEAQMAGIIGTWRNFVSGLCFMLIPIIAYAVLNGSGYLELAANINAELTTLDPQSQIQMTVPIFLRHTLPPGLLGIVGAIILACAISCDDTFLHSWGSILIQDVILPLRDKPITPEKRLRLIRLSIVGVALFAFVFSSFFELKNYILMYFALTGAIYLGGAGVVIICGLYWKYGTTAAAFTALTVGTVLGFGGIVIEQLWQPIAVNLLKCFPDSAWLLSHQEHFPINGQYVYFFAMLTATISYIVISLAGQRRSFNMDKLLHRGAYAVSGDVVHGDEPETVRPGRMAKLFKLLGLTEEFTRFERFLFYATLVWTLAWWLLFLAGCLVRCFHDIADASWSRFWWLQTMLSFGLGSVCSIWIFCGGLRDSLQLFRDLKHRKIDRTDDGSV